MKSLTIQELPFMDLKERNAQILNTPLKGIESLITELLKANSEENSTKRGMEAVRVDFESDITIKFFNCIDLINKSIHDRDFTSLFEYVMRMKLLIATSSEISAITREPTLYFLLNRYCFKLSSVCFNHLEKMEMLAKESDLKFLFE